MIVEDERAGQVLFGKVGKVVEVNADMCLVNFSPGVDSVKGAFVADVSELKSLKKLQKFAGMFCLIRLLVVVSVSK